jgi:hypothetical protein
MDLQGPNKIGLASDIRKGEGGNALSKKGKSEFHSCQLLLRIPIWKLLIGIFVLIIFLRKP